MATPWYIARNNQKFGPFTEGQLRQLAALGMLKPTELLWQEGAPRWVPASSLPDFFPPATAVRKRYWLSLAGEAQGPYPYEQVRTYLLTRQLDGEALACAEDAATWAPLAQLPEFRPFLPSASLRDSHANLVVARKTEELGAEEAELHLAGKQGDVIARLISTLMDLKKKNRDNAAMEELIDRNIQDLKAIRDQRGVGPGLLPAARR
jgi:hypothetical protein